MIAFIGTGLSGANFGRPLLEKGKQVQVWNRSADKAKALDKITDAVKGAYRIHVTLSNDKSFGEVLEKASAESMGIMLVCGDQQMAKTVEPELTSMTGSNLGEQTDKAAATIFSQDPNEQ